MISAEVSADGLVNGSVLPGLTNEDVADRVVAICDLPVDEYSMSTHMLDVKVFRNDGGTNVFVRFSEIGSSRLLQQREAVVSAADQAAIAGALDTAWNAINLNVHSLSKGRIVD